MFRHSFFRRFRRWRFGRYAARPFHSAVEQRAFDLEVACKNTGRSVAMTVSKILYGLY